jgi:hypothetical protein
MGPRLNGPETDFAARAQQPDPGVTVDPRDAVDRKLNPAEPDFTIINLPTTFAFPGTGARSGSRTDLPAPSTIHDSGILLKVSLAWTVAPSARAFTWSGRGRLARMVSGLASP